MMKIRKVRVLHCMETVASGGVEQLKLSIFKRHSKSIFEHRLICTNAGGVIPEQINLEGVEIHKIGKFTHPFQFQKHKQVWEIIRNFKPHIIHGAVFEGNSMAAIGGLFSIIPVVILEETSDPKNRSKKATTLLKILTLFADKIIAISPSVKEYLIVNAKINAKKVVLINNGVKIPVFLPEDVLDRKRQLGIVDQDIVVGFVGRMYDDHKRVSDLIIACSQVKFLSFKLLIIGDGPDRAKIEDLVKMYELESRTIFTGYQGNTDSFYCLMSILCVPSSREGFGLVAAEGMLHRLPLIATSVGGLKDIVVNDVTGFLVPPKSPEKIAEKLKVLIEDPNLRKQFGEAGYLRAMEKYTADRYCKEIEGLYSELLKEKGISI